jgi:hypothetical protein
VPKILNSTCQTADQDRHQKSVADFSSLRFAGFKAILVIELALRFAAFLKSLQESGQLFGSKAIDGRSLSDLSDCLALSAHLGRDLPEIERKWRWTLGGDYDGGDAGEACGRSS